MRKPFESSGLEEVSKPENEEENLTQEEKEALYKEAKKRHPNPLSALEKIKHKMSETEPAQNWLENRAEIMVDKSGINKAVEDFEKGREIKMVDIGGGGQHIEKEIVKNNPDKNISAIGIDISDYASKQVSESKEGKKMESVFGKGENLPIKEKSVEVATVYFTFQELNDKQQKEVLDEMIRIIEEDGKILIVDEFPQEESSKEGMIARAKNILRNVKVSKYNLHSEEEWKNLFEENGLKIVGYRDFRDDEKEVGEKYPPQFFSYILEKAEKKIE